MTIEAGTVVILKSGGVPMTVISVSGDNAECIWIGDDGDLFREKIPMIALQEAEFLDDDEDEDDEDDE